MGRKILCPSCGSILNEDILKHKNSENTCLVCGESLCDEPESTPEEEELVTWYYYSTGRGHYLSDEPLDKYHLEYKFKAPNDMDKAKEILRKEHDSNAFISPSEDTKPTPIVRCPRCHSDNIQLVPRKWSIWTGYRTNAVSRVCVVCKYIF